MHVSDLADIHVKGLGFIKIKKKSFILNCGYGKGYSVKQIIKIFSKIKKNIIIEFKDRRPGDVAQVYADTKKFKRILKWTPKFNNMNSIIKSAIKWEMSLNKKSKNLQK